MHIRAAAPPDAPRIVRLHVESWRRVYREVLSASYLEEEIEAERAALWNDRFSHPSFQPHILVAEEAGESLGFACAYGDDDPEWGTLLDNIHVDLAHQGRGVGKALLGAVAAWSAREYPERGLYLWVVESNVEARKIYAHLAGEIVGSSVWEPPGGGAVPSLRFAWRSAAELAARAGEGQRS
ncbi:MAG TPA: GNAT family N-acetyltransferase [Thermoanaerobaculia bacterium]|nr:GNAT family N-acetyltransferase [Thermoanaerobaculia bacterium]